MQTDAEIVAQAGVVGLVTRREVLSGAVTVRCEPSHHVRAILIGNHPVGYVKEPPSSQADDVIGRERRALRCLRDVDLGPRILLDQPDDTLWVGVVRGVDLAHASGPVPELAEVCEAWGVAVAALHRLPTGRVGITEAPRPWLLEPHRRARVARSAVRGSTRAIVADALDREPSLRAAVSQVGARWTDRHWMHGELTPTNVVVESTPPLRVRFLNFDKAGLGDPTWDLATAVDSVAQMAPRWSTPAEPLVDYFLRGYRRAGGPGTLSPAIQACSALATAWRLAEHHDRPEIPHNRDILGNPEILDSHGQKTNGQPSASDIVNWLDRARSFARRAGAQPRAAA